MQVSQFAHVVAAGDFHAGDAILDQIHKRVERAWGQSNDHSPETCLPVNKITRAVKESSKNWGKILTIWGNRGGMAGAANSRRLANRMHSL